MKAYRFPEGFNWGTATASYQIEGGKGGRAPCIWDAFCKTEGRVVNGDNGDLACDHFTLYKEDVKIMKDMGLKNYRLSIAMPRIFPGGQGPANEEGIAFYNGLIDCLLDAGITPCVTLYHWDLPLELEMEHGGWQNYITVERFLEYAEVCFERFGDRVKSWLTFNEPWCAAVLGYGNGEMAPGCTSSDAVKVYRAGHHMLLGHARAVEIYRKKFRTAQNGVIGVTLNCNWTEPKPSDDPETAKLNAEAAERSVLWNLGWFADPVYKGDYPEVMRNRCGDRLPEFTADEKALLKGSSDFFGLNHYSTDYAEDDSGPGHYVSHWGTVNTGGFWGDMAVRGSTDPSWAKTDMGWPIVPWGFRKLLLWIQARYSPEGGIQVTENGAAVNEPTVDLAVDDKARIVYYEGYLKEMHAAIQLGADVRAYYAWSFMDNFEWAYGYSKRFGLVHVDYNTMKRTPKSSLKWFSKVLSTNTLERRLWLDV
ncbi:Beta-glucosidase, family GH1 [Ectocarpus siliculosus]|uniref:beta-glucosidase n=1 Tax=Ectocarpus siliculosus TaxID=2880 RepID=D7FRA3_ECTSI|nr:Beta-glucosidase, family GH1 [Ectocarpus siliculosus]|eukprot:CBJ30694.1 Beta-glucosidase, family GH1 [Ectocarpus siliculosus]